MSIIQSLSPSAKVLLLTRRLVGVLVGVLADVSVSVRVNVLVSASVCVLVCGTRASLLFPSHAVTSLVNFVVSASVTAIAKPFILPKITGPSGHAIG